MARILAIVAALVGRVFAAGEFLGSTAPATNAITAAPSEAAPANIFPNELADETTGFDSLGPFTEEPSPEQDANPVPAKKGWDNETGLQAFNTWGQSFCTAHRVGSFCDQYTQVRCCRTSWGFAKCGTTVHSSRCGWHAGWGAGGWRAGGWHAGGWHFNEVEQDSLGPFTEEPSPEQDANPVPAKKGWDNETGLQAFNTWGQSFCTAHRVGSFCDQYTQVRCCRTSWGFAKCGTTVHSSRCGWQAGWGAGGWHAGGWHAGGWHFNEVEQNSGDSLGPFTEEPSPEQDANPVPAKKGWDNETGLQAFNTWGQSFCTAHRVGNFCNGHTQVRCCRAGRGYSMCGSTRHSTRCGWHASWAAGGSGAPAPVPAPAPAPQPAPAPAPQPGPAPVHCGGFNAGGCSCRHVRGCRCAGVKAGGCTR